MIDFYIMRYSESDIWLTGPMESRKEAVTYVVAKDLTHEIRCAIITLPPDIAGAMRIETP